MPHAAPASEKNRDLFESLLSDAFAIQDRFVAEPMLKTTGRGHLKSRGVDGLKQDAEELAAKYAQAYVDAKLA